MITSMQNGQVKYLQQLQKKGKKRREEGMFVAEGYRMFQETPWELLEKVYVSQSFFKTHEEELQRYEDKLEVMAEEVFVKAANTMTPQGILCLVRMPSHSLEEILNKDNPFLLVLDNLQDPGNLGTMMRTALGAGADGVILSEDCVDMYNPKVIRSTMGAIYRMPFVYVEDLPIFLDGLLERGVTTYAAHLEGTSMYDEENYQEGTALLIGNEGNGLRDEVTCRAKRKIKIPMKGELESLNAAIAAAILLYEVESQRRI